MKRRPQTKPSRKQPTSDELLGSCLSLIQRKFYEDHAGSFAKDRPRLLKWVVLWPARWLNERGVTISADRYKEIFDAVLLDALAQCRQAKINYLPAYLATVIQSHWRIHGEEYYAQAKSVRNLAENALLMAGKITGQAAPDPIRELATASRLLKPKKKPLKSPLKDQLTLL